MSYSETLNVNNPTLYKNQVESNKLSFLVLCNLQEYQTLYDSQKSAQSMIFPPCPYLSSFLCLAQHDYTLHLLFKYHPPEVIDSVWKWCLSGNVCPLLSVALILVKGSHSNKHYYIETYFNEACIDIIRSYCCYSPEVHTGVII